jgi:hypothetical protein
MPEEFACPSCGSPSVVYPDAEEDNACVVCRACGAFLATRGQFRQLVDGNAARSGEHTSGCKSAGACMRPVSPTPTLILYPPLRCGTGNNAVLLRRRAVKGRGFHGGLDFHSATILATQGVEKIPLPFIDIVLKNFIQQRCVSLPTFGDRHSQ